LISDNFFGDGIGVAPPTRLEILKFIPAPGAGSGTAAAPLFNGTFQRNEIAGAF
jgi:hypothetical protein